MNRIQALPGSKLIQPALQVKVIRPIKCSAYQVGKQIADHSAQYSDKQTAEKVFHGGLALGVGHTQILLSRLEQRPLGNFPDHCSRAKNHNFSVVSDSENPSRPAKRQALNAPTYCKATGRRIGVCTCPKCKPVEKDKKQ